MGRLFPAFGADAAGREVLFVGESHANNASLLALAWQTMWLAGRLDAIFIEYYPLGAGPASPRIHDLATTDGATLKGFSEHREYHDLEPERRSLKKEQTAEKEAIDHRVAMRFYAELAQLKYQCDRYRIRLEGWNRPSVTPMDKLMRSTPKWNELVFQGLGARLDMLGVRSYIVFGGMLHGALMQRCTLFPGGDLPCFRSPDARNLVEYDVQNKGDVVNTLQKLGENPPKAALFGFMLLKKLDITYVDV